VSAPFRPIDVAPLLAGTGANTGEEESVARAIDRACRDVGFFTIVGHGVDARLRRGLDAYAREFFARPDAEKSAIAMARGGRAWRGWFPVGGELTSGRPDRKEGIYFGAELPADDARVRAGRPLHGPNLFPSAPAGLRRAVLDYMDALTALGQTVMRGIALGLGLDREWFARGLTAEPVILFRIFHYPPAAPGDVAAWGVGEHTDYGLLTLLMQDDTGGLQVRTPHGWTDVPPDPDAFVCNVGDMLERITRGRYVSTPHRARSGARDRLSFPFFFDPGWDTDVQPIPGIATGGGTGDAGNAARRWDGASVHDFTGTYGEYLLTKVSRVFPDLGADVLDQ
jgi:isopenicillin N synthase-like dioxygenase